jgi:hypothetical protein
MIRDIAFRIAEKMDLKEWNYNAIISKFSMFGEPTHKFILRVSTSKGYWDFFVKVCKDPTLSKYLINEAKTLEYLNGLGIRGVPNLILRDSYYEKEFVVESFTYGKKMRHHLDIMERASHWLLYLYSQTKKGFVSCNDLMDNASEHANYLSKWFDLDDIVSLMEKCLPDESLPSVFTHGDFWSDNLILTKEGIGVVDFSLSANNQPPLDIFTLISYLSLEDPEILASPKRLRDLTKDFLPSDVDPYFLLIYNTTRRAAQLTRLMEDLYDNLLLLDIRDISKLAMYQIGLLKNLSLKLETK